MAVIPTINNGDPANDTWPDAVTSEVNRTTAVLLAADVSKAASSWSDITGLTAPVTAGRRYLVRAFLLWTQTSTSGGVRVSANFPTGAWRAFVRFSGETAADALINEFHSVADDGSGVATADATGAGRVVMIEGRYNCTSSGTFALRYYRNTTGTAAILEGSGLTLIADA
jgi:hypothetical protein